MKIQDERTEQIIFMSFYKASNNNTLNNKFLSRMLFRFISYF